MWHFPMWWDAFLLVCIAKERIYFESTKFQCVFLIITHQNPLFRLPKASFLRSAPDSTHPSHKCKLFLQVTSVSSNLLPHALPIIHPCRLILSTQFDRTTTNLNTMKEKKPVKNGDKKGSRKLLCEILCDSDRIQTCNLLIRSQMLYSVELRSHFPQNSSSISVE